MVLRLLALLLALALCVAAPAQAALFKPTIHTLDNGLSVMVVENHRAPVVLHMLWYKVGSADEPAAHAGLAHFLEHMMFKGTRADPEQDYSAAIAALGGEDNAFTSYDYTAYFARVHPDQLAQVMQMEAARMAALELDSTDITIEQGVVQQERAQRNEATAEARFGIAVNQRFYGTHPYARPIIGTPETINSYTRSTIRDFYNDFYAPNNAVLIVVGDVKAATVFKLAEDAYGRIPPSVLPPRVRAGDILATPQRLVQHDSSVQQPQLHFMWPAPSAHQDSRSSLALQVLVELLSSPDGRLQQDLVFKGNLAVGANTSYDSDRYNGSAMTFSVSPRDGVSPARLEKAALASWQRALHGISDGAVTRAKQRLLDTATLARDSISTPAYVFGMALTTGQTVADVEQWPRRIATISTAEVRRAAQAFLSTPLLTAQLLPAHDAAKAGSE